MTDAIKIEDIYSSLDQAALYAECVKRGKIESACEALRILLREDDLKSGTTTTTNAADDDDDYAYMDQAELWAVVVERGGLEGATETSKMKVLRKLLREDDKAREAAHEKRRALARATVFTCELVATMKRSALVDALEAFELDTNGKLEILRDRLVRLTGTSAETRENETLVESETVPNPSPSLPPPPVPSSIELFPTVTENLVSTTATTPTPISVIAPVVAPPPTTSSSLSLSSSSPVKSQLKRETSSVPSPSTPKAGTLASVIDGMRTAGLVSSQMIIFIDCTKSNLDNGKHTFGGRSLHDVSDTSKPNLYEQVLSTIGKTLSSFDADGYIPLFGFGDAISTDKSVFPLFDIKTNPKGDKGWETLVTEYKTRIPKINLAGPTSFGPAIRKTIELVKANKPLEFTLCLILCDGQPNTKTDTEAAIVEASKLPIAIIAVGIGDGPWDELRRFDDDVKGRKFDNFCFVELAGVQKNAKADGVSFAAALACDVLTELPSAYADSVRLGYLNKKW
jgi:E3 ubiquitin-protein ligase RGLG